METKNYIETPSVLDDDPSPDSCEEPVLECVEEESSDDGPSPDSCKEETPVFECVEEMSKTRDFFVCPACKTALGVIKSLCNGAHICDILNGVRDCRICWAYNEIGKR